MKLSKYIISTSLNDGEEGADAQRIIYSCISNVTVVVSESIFHHLVNGCIDRVDNGIRKELEHVSILVPPERDELAAILDGNDLYHDNFSLFINTSAACRSGCNSCTPKQGNESMGDPVREALAHYTENQLSSEKYKAFNVIWNVGDPARDLPAIAHLSDSNCMLADRYAVLYTAAMICDGAYLHKEIFETLFYRCNIKNYHVALDGGGNGQPSNAHLVIGNIVDILNSFPFLPQEGIIFEIRININTFSQEAVVDIIDKLAAAHTQNRVTFQFGMTEDGQTDAEVLAEYEIEYVLYAIQQGFILGILPARTFTACAAVDKGAAAVDLQGNLFSCNALPAATAAIIGANTLGNLLEGQPFRSHDTQFRNWLHEIKNGDTDCYTCNLLPVCGGGCRLKWAEGQSGCPAFKYNMEDRLILSYLNQKTRMNELIIEA